jgi:hypothetical protein
MKFTTLTLLLACSVLVLVSAVPVPQEVSSPLVTVAAAAAAAAAAASQTDDVMGTNGKWWNGNCPSCNRNGETDEVYQRIDNGGSSS